MFFSPLMQSLQRDIVYCHNEEDENFEGAHSEQSFYLQAASVAGITKSSFVLIISLLWKAGHHAQLGSGAYE